MIDGVKALVLLCVVAVLQTAAFSDVQVLGGTPDAVLVVLIGVALLRGPVTGALAGFLAGLVLDVATLDTPGVTSLLLVLVGYWVGRYGETFAHDRQPGATLAVVAMTVVYAIAALALRAVLGESPSPRVVLVDHLFPSLALNALVGVPAFWLCRRIFRPRGGPEHYAGSGGGSSSGGPHGRGGETEFVG